MFQPGLVSVTFKRKSCADVIELARVAGLKAIEWHGLNHVPHGDLEAARRVGQCTRDADLALAAYGSYYVIGESEAAGLRFESVLQTAEVLGAPMIRVWAGDKNPDEVSDRARSHIVKETRRIADLAARNDIRIVLEFHENSLTQTGPSCAALLRDVDHRNVRTYWQPAPGLDATGNLAEFREVMPWTVGLHVFHWRPTHRDRHPLAQGESDWSRYLAAARQCPGETNVLLEFVKGDTTDQFRADATTLHRLLKQLK